jgi:glutamate formiminotransferase / 5-formyltetrahydrofolate cyclo-ligase
MAPPTLLAVPNLSEGRDASTISALRGAFEAAGARVLDVHCDRDHHRSVFTITAAPHVLADAMLSGARVAVERIDVMHRSSGSAEAPAQHPHVGALDVAPVVYLEDASRGAACAEALVVADRIAHELAVPVFLYGELTAGDGAPARTRAELRRGGVAGLAARMAAEDAAHGLPLAPDFGPRAPHRTAGATLVAARAPLVAFNLRLAVGAGLPDARRIAEAIREDGSQGLPGLRAIAISSSDGAPQVAMNVERPAELPLAAIVDAVSAHARVESAEIVGLAPQVALRGFPADIPIIGFAPDRQVIENAIG